MLQQKRWAMGPELGQFPACLFISDSVPGAELRALGEEMPVYCLQCASTQTELIPF